MKENLLSYAKIGKIQKQRLKLCRRTNTLLIFFSAIDIRQDLVYNYIRIYVRIM